MANALTMKAKPLKVLLWGPSGTGKTKLASTFPNPHFIDLDNGMLTVAGQDVRYITLSEKQTEDTDFDEICKSNKKDPVKQGAQSLYAKTVFLLNHWGNELTEEDTLVVDSLTMLNRAAISYTLKLSGVSAMRQNDWGAAQALIENIFEEIKTTKCHVVFIAHDSFVKDEESGFVSWLPATIGKLATRVACYFDEVWLTGTERSKDRKGEQDYYIETRPTRRTTAKSRLSLPDKIVAPTFDKINKLRQTNQVEGGAKKRA